MADDANSLAERAHRVLRDIFLQKDFREGQLEAISAVMNGKDTIVRLGTNGGKSLCYQLPPQLFERPCCLVVSPLTALMDEQVGLLTLLLTVP